MQTIRSIIVEDEAASRNALRNYLQKYCPHVQIVDMAASVKEAEKAIRQYQPDLVFLDVEMPFGNAFDLLEKIAPIHFKIIFVTAYSHYAIRALNASASYYLLKPVNIDELIDAVEKVGEELKSEASNVHTQVLLENLQVTQKQLHKLVLPLIDGFEVIQMKDVIRCKGNGNFTDFYLLDGSKKMICRTLRFYEETLEEFGFMRVHKSHILNLQFVRRYKKGKGGQAIMEGGAIVDIAPSKKQEFMNRFASS